MTRDDIIRWAREAGFQTGSIYGGDGNPIHPLIRSIGDSCTVEMERFAKLVAAAEREACARICDGQHEEDRPSDYAYAIRARKDSA